MGPRYQFHLIQAIRNFFIQNSFTDVLTPPIVQSPGIEPHIHPLQIQSIYQPSHKLKNESTTTPPYFLHTSPEFHMKELLSLGMEKIFTVNYSFRDEPKSPLHRKQFLMLEWYRAQERYEKIMDDCQQLITYSLSYLLQQNVPTLFRPEEINFKYLTIKELFQEFLEINILDFLEVTSLKDLILQKFPQIILPKSSLLLWEDLYHLLFLNLIEPHLTQYPFLILYEFPAPLAALSTLKADDPKVCERFEIFISGIEIGNCYNELCDESMQEKRYLEFAKLKNDLYHYQTPRPERLLNSLKRGLPPSAGIAIGVERLLLTLTGVEDAFYSGI